MFFSLDRLVTGNQILNNKCQRQFLLLFQFERRSFQAVLFSFQIVTTTKTMAEIWYLVYVLWGQPIKLAQVASTSELLENQWNDLVFFKIVPSLFCRASEVSRIDYFKD